MGVNIYVMKERRKKIHWGNLVRANQDADQRVWSGDLLVKHKYMVTNKTRNDFEKKNKSVKNEMKLIKI